MYINVPEKLNVDINIDGHPLFSRTQLWPIFIRINNIQNSLVFPVDIYMSKTKPNDCSEYLHKFTSELSDILLNGFKFDGNNLRCTCKSFRKRNSILHF